MTEPISIREMRPSDIDAVQEILEAWMRDDSGRSIRHDNVQAAIKAMQASMTSDDPTYLVIDNGDAILGVAGFTTIDIDPELINDAPRPVEVVNVYISPAERAKGLGTLLMNEVEKRLRAMGYDTLIIVSGSRNRTYGYPFWERRYGPRARTDVDYFGLGTERAVWQVALVQT